jgi:hypothetical protein
MSCGPPPISCKSFMCEALLIAGNCGLPFASGPRKMADPVTTLEVR